MRLLPLNAALLLLAFTGTAHADYSINLADTDLKLTLNGATCELILPSEEEGDEGDALVEPIRQEIALTEIKVTRTTDEEDGITKLVALKTIDGARISCVDYVELPDDGGGNDGGGNDGGGNDGGGNDGGGNDGGGNDGGGNDGDGTPPPAGVDLSACGNTWPANVVRGDILNLAQPLGQTQKILQQKTLSFPFKSTSTSTFYMQLTYGAVMGTTYVGREAWISECPTQSYADARNACKVSGAEAGTISIAQYNKRGACQLTPNKQYFWNIRNTNCPGGNCNIYVIMAPGTN